MCKIFREFFAPVFSDRGRCLTVFMLLAISISLRAPILVAITVGITVCVTRYKGIQVQQFPLCKDPFRSESVFPTEWAAQSHAYYVFDFHVIVALQVRKGRLMKHLDCI